MGVKLCEKLYLRQTVREVQIPIVENHIKIHTKGIETS